MKLLRTIRLDPSDTFVFEQAAEPGEWAVSGGALLFGESDPAKLTGKARAAFRSGFLGVSSLGRSTLVQVVDATEEDRAAAVEMLVRSLATRLDDPDEAFLRAVAEAEVAFAISLCEHAVGTLIAVHRTVEADAIRETFRTLRPREGEKPARAFSFLEVEGEDDAAEKVDLIGLARGRES